MLTELFTSRTRIHLFLKLFLNPQISCYLRELAREFNLTPNALKEELDNLSRAGYLKKNNGDNTFFTRPIRTTPFSRKSIPSSRNITALIKLSNMF